MNQKVYLLLILINLLIVINASTNRLLRQHCLLNTEEPSTKYFDLRSLSLKNNYFTILNGSDTFLINICSNSNSFLSPHNTSVCSKSTTICWISDENSNGVELAKIYAGVPTFNEKHNIQITYNRTVKNSPQLNCTSIETKITFFCQLTRALQNVPVLKSKTNCNFEFEWQTSEACLDEHNKIEPHFKNESLVFLIGNNKTIDLQSIFTPQTIKDESSPEKYDFVIARDMERYLQNVTKRNQYSKDLSKCYNAFVCQLKQDRAFIRAVGKLNSSSLNNDGKHFHLVLTSDSKCGRTNNQINTSVIFNLYCDGKTKNITEFKAENNLCSYIFDLYDPQICEFERLLAEVNAKTTTATTQTTTVRSSLVDDPKTTEKMTVRTTEKVTEKPAKIAPNLSAIHKNSKPSSDSFRHQPTQPSDSNSNTYLFGVIILVIVSVVGIVLAVISLMNDDRRAWLQNRARRVIKPQTATSFHYSQLSSAKILLMNSNQQHENLNSPYSSTVMPKNDQMRYEAFENEPTEENRFNLRNNSNNVQSSIRDQLDRLRMINDNDLGVSRNDFHSTSFRSDRRSSLKDEAELNLLT